MICINEYSAVGVDFTCTVCDKEMSLEFKNSIKDNSVQNITVECAQCGDVGELSVLKCKDEFMASTLLGKLQKLKEDMEEDTDG